MAICPRAILAALPLALAISASPTKASVAYGSINNFDTVNDTGSEAHGFEIELDDISCKDITYTYDWNHYGAPSISEDTSDPAHPKVTVRYASRKNPDGSWAAYTAVPSGTIQPTDGHQFTDPSVNFGGEHFGVGYMAVPTAVRYHWLVDNGSGTLVAGPPVQIGTPVFNYIPPAGPAQPAVVQAIVQAPPAPPEAPVKEFGEPVWVKEIRTTSHSARKVELRDLVSDNPDDPDDRDWRNGEPDEVEVEWQLMQEEFNKQGGGANGELAAAPEELQEGDEVVTRRYEFFRYVGPLDEETGEALADKVGPDGIHGVVKTKEDGTIVDFSDSVIVGDYIGAQMSAFDPGAALGLIDYVQDAFVGEAYPSRTLIVPGAAPFVAMFSGTLPIGMEFDVVSGVLSGTPSELGTFQFTVEVKDGVTEPKKKNYTLTVALAPEDLPPKAKLSTSAWPAGGGDTAGDGDYDAGEVAAVTAAARAGYVFRCWTDHGKVISGSETCEVPVEVNRALVANYAPAPVIGTNDLGDFEMHWPSSAFGWIRQESGDMVAWTNSVLPPTSDGTNSAVPVLAPSRGTLFYRLVYP